MSVICLLYIAAFILWILSGIGKCPAWVPGLLVTVGLLLGCLGK